MTKTSRTLKTKVLGSGVIEPEQVLDFPEGLYGFREFTEFALLEENPENPFKWLQSTQEPGLAFIIIQPELIMTDYLPDIAREELASIDIASPDEALVFLIVTIPENQPEKMTANLQGPILINRETKKSRQAISMDESHVVRLSILSRMES